MDPSQEEYLKILFTPQGLMRRDDCKDCADTAPACDCKDGQQCQQILRTCEVCAYNKCVGEATSSSPKKNIGGIVGGVLGGIFFIGCIIFYIVWNHKNQKKSNRFLKLDAQGKAEVEIIDGGGNDGFKDDINLQNMEAPPKFSRSPDEISLGSKRFSKRASSYRNSQATFSSLATSALSRASNIIPIAYIPGVKVRSNSTLLNNRQIVDDRASIDSRTGKTTFGGPLSTMTAVRAIPKLVDVKKSSNLRKEIIEEESDSASYTSGENFRKNNPSLKTLTQKELQQRERKNVSGLTHIIEEENNLNADELISLGSLSDDDYDDDEEVRKVAEGLTPKIETFKAVKVVRPSDKLLKTQKNSPINPFDDDFEVKK